MFSVYYLWLNPPVCNGIHRYAEYIGVAANGRNRATCCMSANAAACQRTLQFADGRSQYRNECASSACDGGPKILSRRSVPRYALAPKRHIAFLFCSRKILCILITCVVCRDFYGRNYFLFYLQSITQY